ncbi:MAG: hypothetical protein LBL82_08690 [Oscillospiraceae bacterium]|nr:hypothetical protein [Oscillospiraceae bacterium]
MSFAVRIASASGGSGASSLAAGVASALSLMSFSVLCVDLCGGGGSIAPLLCREELPVYNVGDVLCGRCDVRDAIIEVSPTLSILSAAERMEQAEPSSMAQLSQLLAAGEYGFDYVVYDTPSFLSEHELAMSDQSGLTVISMLAERHSVERAAKRGRILRRNERLDVRFVINRFSASDARRRDEFDDLDAVTDSVGVRLLGVVPEIGSKDAFSINQKGAYTRIAQRILGQAVPIGDEIG